jgi:hypothetical protein
MMAVEQHAYDPAWPARFEATRAELAPIFGPHTLDRPHRQHLDPRVEGTVPLEPVGLPGLVKATPARFDLFTKHRIRIEVQARPLRKRRHRCRSFPALRALVLTSRFPADAPVVGAPEALVQAVAAHGPDGVTHGAASPQKFGILPVREPSDANRYAAGFLQLLVSGDPVVGQLLEETYVADEHSFPAFTQRQEEGALVDYCKVLETIATVISREHKQGAANQRAIEDEISEIMRTFEPRLAKAPTMSEKVKLVREAQRDISAANLEFVRRKVLKAGELLLIPTEVLATFGQIWMLRSSTASHAGGRGWPVDALLDARMVVLVFLSHFVASRRAAQGGMTLAQAVGRR